MHGSTGGNWKRSKPDHGHEEERPRGKPLGHQWLRDLPPGNPTAPVPDPTVTRLNLTDNASLPQIGYVTGALDQPRR